MSKRYPKHGQPFPNLSKTICLAAQIQTYHYPKLSEPISIYSNLSKLIQSYISNSIFKFIQTYLSKCCHKISKYIQNNPSYSEHPIPSCPNLTQPYWSLSKPIQIFPIQSNLSKTTQTCPNLSKPVQSVPKPVHTYFIVSKPIQTYPTSTKCFLP